jgi:hypothetical protein
VFDGFVILYAPNESTVTAFILATMGPGHIRVTKTTVLMSPGVMFEAMKKARRVEYQGPRK